ncbi:MAG TPA: hypothetical protein VJA63_01225 [Candidatus Paceibacterota bacterium]
MIKKRVVKKLTQERVLLGVGLVLFLLLVGATIYAFSFLGKNILRSLSPNEVGGDELEFNLEEFDNLGL